MDNEKNDIEKLARQFERQLRHTNLPEMETADLLDLMDYYVRMGMDFEADLCRYIAERNDPENPEVIITQAHSKADEGDWNGADALCEQNSIAGYDNLLFDIEHAIKVGQTAEAFNQVEAALPAFKELPDNDFLFDSAALFRDYGYMDYALKCLADIDADYIDHTQVQEMKAECLTLMGRNVESKAVLEKLIDKEPFNKEMWDRMASYCYMSNDYEAAGDACEYSLAISSSEEALRLKSFIAVAQSAPDELKPLIDEACSKQDYQLCLECADKLYAAGFYSHALPGYGIANLYCPRGHRDRERILNRRIFCNIHLGSFAAADECLTALSTFEGEHWGTYVEAAQLFLEKQQVRAALKCFETALHKECAGPSRYEQVALLLDAFEVYDEADALWAEIFEHQSSVTPLFKKCLQHYQEHRGR